MPAAQRDERVEAIALQELAGRVVREIDRNEAGVGPDGGRDGVDVERPAARRIECDAGHRAKPEGHALGRLVVRRDDNSVIVGAKERVHRRVDAFLGAGEAENR